MKSMTIGRKTRWLVGLVTGVMLAASIVVLCRWNWIFGNSEVESAVYSQHKGELYCKPHERVQQGTFLYIRGCGRMHPIKTIRSKPGIVKDVWVVTIEADCDVSSVSTASTSEYRFANGELTYLRDLGYEFCSK